MDKRLIVTSLITGLLLCSAAVTAQSQADVPPGECAKAGIAKTSKPVADIEDEARRASVAPGWLR